MRIAFQFHRPDVDSFLSEVDHEQYEDWREFFATEPQGWEAMRRCVQRITYLSAQQHSKKQLKESDFELRLRTSNPIASAEIEAARWEAFSIRQTIAAEMQKKRKA